jgi:hypothetical protein
LQQVLGWSVGLRLECSCSTRVCLHQGQLQLYCTGLMMHHALKFAARQLRPCTHTCKGVQQLCRYIITAAKLLTQLPDPDVQSPVEAARSPD